MRWEIDTGTVTWNYSSIFSMLMTTYIHHTFQLIKFNPSSIGVEAETPHFIQILSYHSLMMMMKETNVCDLTEYVVAESVIRPRCAHFNPIISFKPISGFTSPHHATAPEQKLLIQQATAFILSHSPVCPSVLMSYQTLF